MFRVEQRSGVGAGIRDHDGDQRRRGHGFSSLPASLDGGVAFAVVQVHRVIPGLGNLRVFGPGYLKKKLIKYSFLKSFLLQQ